MQYIENNRSDCQVFRWTISAKECYNRGCICEGCIYENLETRCQMKYTVLKLVKIFGRPSLNDNILDNEGDYDEF